MTFDAVSLTVAIGVGVIGSAARSAVRLSQARVDFAAFDVEFQGFPGCYSLLEDGTGENAGANSGIEDSTTILERAELARHVPGYGGRRQKLPELLALPGGAICQDTLTNGEAVGNKV